MKILTKINKWVHDHACCFSTALAFQHWSENDPFSPRNQILRTIKEAEEKNESKTDGN